MHLVLILTVIRDMLSTLPLGVLSTYLPHTSLNNSLSCVDGLPTHLPSEWTALQSQKTTKERPQYLTNVRNWESNNDDKNEDVRGCVNGFLR